jgi:uncharacterized protein (DUF427 family)
MNYLDPNKLDDNLRPTQTHTPGPWYEMTKGENKYQSSICQEATGKTIAVTYTSNDADARLIAAAPDLLQALKDELQALFTWSYASPLHKDVKQGIAISIDKIERAIAKAEGL